VESKSVLQSQVPNSNSGFGQTARATGHEAKGAAA